MDDLWSVERFCRWFYELPDDAKPSKSQANTVSQMCRDGVLPAVKVGIKWRIDTSQILEEVRHG